MVEVPFKPASFSPRTLEDAQFLAEQGERERARAIGDWLPEGWEQVDEWRHSRLGRGSVGAFDQEHNILVYVVPPEWTCPYCGTTDRLASPCTSSDFLDDETRADMLLKWKIKQRDGAVLKVRGHGVPGAPKVIFDMVWNRWVTLMERQDG